MGKVRKAVRKILLQHFKSATGRTLESWILRQTSVERSTRLSMAPKEPRQRRRFQSWEMHWESETLQRGPNEEDGEEAVEAVEAAHFMWNGTQHGVKSGERIEGRGEEVGG